MTLATDGHNFAALRAHILDLSVSKDWAVACLEWTYLRSHHEEGGVCPCGYWPITEHCWIRNRLNGNETHVGNVCIRRFRPELGTLMDGIERIRHNPGSAPNPALIEYASKRGWLSEWQQEFLGDTKRKRKLTEKQLAKRIEANRRILARLELA